MCKELVRELQNCPDAEYGCSQCEFQMTLNCRERLMKKAADAIEELSREYESMVESLNESVELVRKLQSPIHNSST